MGMEYLIWIGDKIPNLRNLNQLNLNEYLYRGSILITDMDCVTQDVNPLKNQLKFGGTVLEFDETGGLQFRSFKPAGNFNVDSMNGDYLAGIVEYTGGNVQRIKYSKPENMEAFSSRVMTADVVYMITYGLKVEYGTRAKLVKIMDFLNVLLPEGHKDNLIDPGKYRLSVSDPIQQQAQVQYVPTLLPTPRTTSTNEPRYTGGELIEKAVEIGVGTVGGIVVGGLIG